MKAEYNLKAQLIKTIKISASCSVILLGMIGCNTLNESSVAVKPLNASAPVMVKSVMASAPVLAHSVASDANIQKTIASQVIVESEDLSESQESVVGSMESDAIENQPAQVLPESTLNIHGALLPEHRIIAYYGNPLSKRMGVLGEYDHSTMIAKLNKEVAAWTKADPQTPAIPALHLIAVVAQGAPGKAGKYRMIMPDEQVNKVYEWAKQDHALFFIDIQTGHDNIRNILPMFEWILKNPDVHLGIDPEFNLISSQAKPGTRIGTYDAGDINYVSGYLQKLATQYHLPPKILVVHRFTQRGVTNAKKITLRQNVQIVMNMDGWGSPILKRGTYRNFIVPEPVQYTGFKLFYHNDTKAGDKLMTPADVLKLNPQPLYIQYQ